MRRQRVLSAEEALTLATLIAMARIGLGTVATFAPTLTGRLLLGDRSGAGAVATRMLGGRDVALGLGALLAVRRGKPAAVRGWLEAGALADLVDTAAFLGGRTLPRGRRVLSVVASGGAGAAGMVLARLVTSDDPQARGA